MANPALTVIDGVRVEPICNVSTKSVPSLTVRKRLLVTVDSNASILCVSHSKTFRAAANTVTNGPNVPTPNNAN